MIFWNWSLYNVIVNVLFNTLIMIICKKNSQSVYDADQEIPTRKLYKPLALSVYSRVGISRSASKTVVRFYLSGQILCSYDT